MLKRDNLTSSMKKKSQNFTKISKAGTKIKISLHQMFLKILKRKELKKCKDS